MSSAMAPAPIGYWGAVVRAVPTGATLLEDRFNTNWRNLRLMDISFELIRIVDYSIDQAIDKIMNTDEALLSFMNIDMIDGQFGTKEFPDGTTDDDLISVASLPLVQRYVLLTSGKMQSENGSIPILMVIAAERGDPTGFLFVQRFTSGQSPLYSETDGRTFPAQTQENFFKHAPPHRMGDDQQGSLLITEAFKRFGRRLMKRAFNDPEPKISTIMVMLVDGKIEGEASFFYVHGKSGTTIKVTFTQEENVFVLQQVLKMDDQGKSSDLEDELKTPILDTYQNALL